MIFKKSTYPKVNIHASLNIIILRGILEYLIVFFKQKIVLISYETSGKNK